MSMLTRFELKAVQITARHLQAHRLPPPPPHTQIPQDTSGMMDDVHGVREPFSLAIRHLPYRPAQLRHTSVHLLPAATAATTATTISTSAICAASLCEFFRRHHPFTLAVVEEVSVLTTFTWDDVTSRPHVSRNREAHAMDNTSKRHGMRCFATLKEGGRIIIPASSSIL